MNPNAKQCKFCLTIRRFGRYEDDAPNCKNCVDAITGKRLTYARLIADVSA